MKKLSFWIYFLCVPLSCYICGFVFIATVGICDLYNLYNNPDYKFVLLDALDSVHVYSFIGNTIFSPVLVLITFIKWRVVDNKLSNVFSFLILIAWPNLIFMSVIIGHNWVFIFGFLMIETVVTVFFLIVLELLLRFARRIRDTENINQMDVKIN